MDDTISRQAAIDIVVFECGKWTGLAQEISKQLKRLPPAQPGIKEMAVDIGYLRGWYQSSVLDDEWPDRYIEEVYHDFYLIPKQGGERDE